MVLKVLVERKTLVVSAKVFFIKKNSFYSLKISRLCYSNE